ncbi:MAG TPA: hypothetical protein VJV23_13300 [Candidatus Polarisedimenticolia bacterium]|nr:hypothetical protein [Candidatus Polarisedimenticolia bacterium]
MKKAVAAMLLLAGWAAAGQPAWAEKLIVFKNGKAMRAKSIVPEGEWLKCEFDDKNYMMIKASLVEGIQEAAVGSRDAELRTNQVAIGSGPTGRAPAQFAPEGLQQHEVLAAQQQQQQEAQDQAELQQAIAEEREAMRRQGQPGPTTALRGRGIGVPLDQQQQQQGVIPGLQPLNQVNTPFSSRRGLSPRQGLLKRGGAAQGEQSQPPPEESQD